MRVANEQTEKHSKRTFIENNNYFIKESEREREREAQMQQQITPTTNNSYCDCKKKITYWVYQMTVCPVVLLKLICKAYSLCCNN